MFRFLILISALLCNLTAWAAQTPSEVVAKATSQLTERLNQTPVEQRTENLVRELVMSFIVPAIDQEKIAKGALGKYWRLASSTQQQEFIDRFRELQIRTYSGAFKAFSGEKLEFEEARINPEGDKAFVQGFLTQSNGNTVPIDFKLYRKDTEDQWRVYDAVVSGLSMVKTYRDQMAERLQGTHPGNAKTRMDDLLQQLQQEADRAAQANLAAE
ncbi:MULTISPECIES: phospholipid-binding protein MlaC [unclassified Oceanobacter]|uniref:MlaC/ttg2D family ABC transporter substrate-binding protein n=1 Tax=unclassified Oceanobacter TaxID=2620260 RepID=UPI0026E4239B|nr:MULTISPECIES: ABC transporter substrate-binding protein [unclassified Oceanobacter]MDO6682866.1 ABC transporter substrate-binding protein [Oceanobacter sp. 5_MG-2023]MDP2505625.1 ABC transporter substrate-binding protein [Oceanobacter sp. 3_MG-2023]MDP2547207.1 ABC transporter substrate-binding protein [Oceanobacter sp. 4_MG-2023]MDP2609374.1 ABC transporter substrate-binding protein [Oceanobacter sp. 1_MG-2023]MDP2612757.1 ABC transporter substrate-binding protein [Oceanobacter sp. 2_MG-20